MLAMQLPELPVGPSLEDVRGPIELSSGYGLWQILLASLAVLLIAGLFVWLYLRSIKQPTTPIDPAAAALSEIDAAAQAIDDERCALICANAVRRLIAARFDVPATSQTSSELCSRLPLDPDKREGIRSFLERCDRVKFARQALSSEQRRELMDTAKQLIHRLQGEEGRAA